MKRIVIWTWMFVFILVLLVARVRAAEVLDINCDESIPSILITKEPVDSYPDPICGKCKIVARIRTEQDGSNSVTLAIEYRDDWRPSMVADVRLTVLLDDGEREVIVGEGRWFENGELSEWDLSEDLIADWRFAEYLWIELIPSA